MNLFSKTEETKKARNVSNGLSESLILCNICEKREIDLKLADNCHNILEAKTINDTNLKNYLSKKCKKDRLKKKSIIEVCNTCVISIRKELGLMSSRKN